MQKIKQKNATKFFNLLTSLLDLLRLVSSARVSASAPMTVSTRGARQVEAGLSDGGSAVLWPPQSALVRGKRALETAAPAVTESFLSPAVYNYTNRETECRLISLWQTEIRRQPLTGHEEVCSVLCAKF